MKNLYFTMRLLRRNPLLVFVNVPGLAVGLSVVLLLLVYLDHELSYDKHFETKDRVLRLYGSVKGNNNSSCFPISLRDAYHQIPEDVPEVEAATQILRGWEVNLESETKKFPSMDLLYVDPGFLEVFGKELISGDDKTALIGDKKVVLSSSTADKIFGSPDCVGRIVTISEESFIVTGVMEDLPETTHFNFDLLATMETIKPDRFGGLEFFTYFLIHEDADIDVAGQKIALVNDELSRPWAEQFNREILSGTELLSNIHLHTRADFDLSPKANLTHILIVGGIAFFILLLAMVNFINLYILHSEKRMEEIATRKTLGASKWNMGKLFYAETGLIGLAAFALAVLFAWLAQSHFSTLMMSTLDVSRLFSLSGISIVLLFISLLIIISGAWPTFYLSTIKLVDGLKGKSGLLQRKGRLTVIAVLVQFTITVFLLSSLIIIRAQVNHLRNVPHGFNSENVIGMRGFNSQVSKHINTIEKELSHYSFVENVGFSFHNMGGGTSGQGIKKYGDPGRLKSVNEYRVQPGFCKTMKLQLIDGTYLKRSKSGPRSIILNEKAVKMLGLENPVGTLVQMHEEPLEVTGVVSDFYYSNHAGESIAPLAITSYSDEVAVMYLRVNGEFTPERHKQVAGVFSHYDPGYVSGFFHLSDIYNNKFAGEERVMKLVSTGTALAIILSFMGLLALSILNVNRRRKEIGIRKVMGSTENEVVIQLLRGTMVWVLVATLLAFVLDFFVMREWLSNFASRIFLHPGYFLLSGVFAFSIAFIAIGWQSWRAATCNPVEALKDE